MGLVNIKRRALLLFSHNNFKRTNTYCVTSIKVILLFVILSFENLSIDVSPYL